jgi:hypothetical protein
VFSKGYIDQQKSEEKAEEQAERDRTNALHEKLLFVDLLAQRLEFSMVRLAGSSLHMRREFWPIFTP